MPQYQGVWNLQDAARLQSIGQWVKDPQFNQTTLLLQADNAANSAQNNTFYDSSTNSFAITRNGGNPGMTQGSFTPFSQAPGYWGNYFDGSSSYITAPDNAAWYFTGNYTIEFWVNVSAYPGTATSALFAQWVDGSGNNRNVSMNMDTAGVTTFYQNFSGTSYSPITTILAKGVWYHIAVVLSGTSLAMWVNGVRTGTPTTVSGSPNDSIYAFAIGADSGGSYKFNGYISNFRVVKGTALYNTASTVIAVPDSPLTAVSGTSLLTCQSNRFVDNGTANAGSAFTLTINGTPSVQAFAPFAPQYQWTSDVIGGSGYFDGTGDYLSTSSYTALQLTNATAFCIEAWIYPTSFSGGTGDYAIIGKRSGGTTEWQFFVKNSTSVYTLYVYNGSTAYTSTTAISAINQWVHVAVSWDLTTLRFFINGALCSSTYTTFSLGTPSTANVNVGSSNGSIEYWNGYISGLRVVKGSAVYTSTFPVPTAPPTAITNTQLLLNFTNAGIYDGTMKNDLETVGNASVSTSVVKYGSGSMYFDGSGDYLLLAAAQSNPGLLLGTGPFTIEFWFNTTSSTQYAQFVGNENGTAGDIGFTILINVASSTGGEVAVFRGASGQINATTSSYRDSAWHHCAFVRDSSGSRLYIDGSQQGSTNAGQATTDFSANGGFRWSIGANLRSTGRDYLGYIDDLRVTKGVARYTANFTPPQVALPRQ